MNNVLICSKEIFDLLPMKTIELMEFVAVEYGSKDIFVIKDRYKPTDAHQFTSKLELYKYLESFHIELDPSKRDWEYDGDGNKIYKGTRKTYP